MVAKYQAFVDLVILNPTITVILMAKFSPTINAYLFPYIIEGYDNKILQLDEFKVAHINYTMGTRTYICT